MIVEDKPSLDELAHHGVKGQKWGVRHKPTKSDIAGARARNVLTRSKISTQQLAVTSARTDKAVRVQTQKLDKMKASFLKNPDRLTAQKLTTGEKFAAGLFVVATGVGVVPVGGVLLARQHHVNKTRREVAGRTNR